MSSKSTSDITQEFHAYYLQRATKELAEDLDKVRSADDFKNESAIPMLIHALQQGTGMFDEAERRRIVEGGKSGDGKQ